MVYLNKINVLLHKLKVTHLVFLLPSTPVSYTHLDVYKRQGWNRSTSFSGHSVKLHDTQSIYKQTNHMDRKIEDLRVIK